MLVAVVLGCSLDDAQHLAWTERMQSLMPDSIESTQALRSTTS